jgi:RHS repeat-associated protein
MLAHRAGEAKGADRMTRARTHRVRRVVGLGVVVATAAAILPMLPLPDILGSVAKVMGAQPADAAATCSFPTGTQWADLPLTRQSISTAGAQGDADTSGSAVSADGHYVFFRSAATTLVDGQTTSGTNLYRRDRTTNQTTKLAIPNPGNFSVSADGNQIAYDSTDPGYFAGDPDPAYTFDGADKVQLPSGFANLTTGLTLEAWVNPTMVTTGARIIQLGNGVANNDIQLERNGSTNTLSLVVYKGTTKVGQIDAANALVLNQWQHIAVTMSTAGAVTIYRNGASVATGTTQVPNNIARASDYIGSDGTSSFWTGRLDEVSVNTSPLTAAQISAHYAARYTGYSTSVKANSPYGYWRLGEPVPATHVATATAVDASTNSRNGTYSGNLYGFGTNGALTKDLTDGSDVFVYNVSAGTTNLVSLTATSLQPNGMSFQPAISADGNFVAFSSAATNMIAGDTNIGLRQIYARNRLLGLTTRESVSSTGAMLDPSAGFISAPAISGDGSKVAYQSTAWNLLGGDLDLAMGSATTSQVLSQVTVPNQTAVNLTGNLTLEGWVYPLATGAYRMIATKVVGDGSTNGTFQFYLDPNNTVGFTQFAGTRQSVLSSGTLPSYRWSHVAVTKSGTAVTLYINGAAAGAGTITGAVSTNTNPLRLGAREDGFYFDGRTDEIAAYNTALAPARILAHVQARTTGYAAAVNIDHPVGYWRLGEGSAATTAADASGNARNGTYAAGSSPGWRGALSGDINEINDTFYRNRTTSQTTRASVTSTGAEVYNSSSTLYISNFPLLSADGNVVAWISKDPLDGQPSPDGDAFTHDMATGKTVRDSVNASGGVPGGVSVPTSLSADGRYMSFWTNGPAALGGDPDHSVQFGNGSVTLPSGFANFTSTGITIEAWADPSSAASNARIVDLGNGQASNNIVLTRNGTTNTLSLLVYNGATLAGRVDAANAIDLNKWQHFAATITPGGIGTIYKDGVSIASGAIPLPTNINRTSNLIGKSNWTADTPYVGLLDEVAIYANPLTAAQVLQHYQARTTSYKTSVLSNSPLGYWRLGETSSFATTAADTSGHNLTGTYSSAGVLTGNAAGALGVDTNNVADVFVKDRVSGQIMRASETDAGVEAPLKSTGGSLSADGRIVAFESDAALVSPDNNAKRDAYARDRSALGGFGLTSTLTSNLVAQSDELGLEQFEPYVKTDLGSGSAYTHLRTGNLVVQYDDTTVPGQGVNAVVRHTYNSQRQVDEGLGTGWSLSVTDASAGLDGLVGEGQGSGTIAEIDPQADLKIGSFGQIVAGVFQAAGQIIELTDGDGTTHRFVRQGGPCGRWDSPPGVSLKIREEYDPITHLPTAYEFVRPDGVVYRAQQITLGGIIPTTVWRVVSVTDRRGNQLQYHYLAYGLVLPKIRLDYIAHNRYPTPPNPPLIQLHYTPAGDLTQIESLPNYSALDPASGFTRSWTRQIDFGVDPNAHQLLTVKENTQTLPQGATDGYRLTSFGYDPTTKLVSTVTDGRNNQTQFTTAFGAVTNIKDRRQNNWTYTYGSTDSTGGRTTTAARPGGNSTSYTISGRAAISGSDQRIAGGNVKTITDAGNDGGPVSTNYTWTANRLTQVKDGANAIQSFEYNDLGLLTKVTKPPTNDPSRTDLPASAYAPVINTLTYSYPSAWRYDASNCTDPSPPSPGPVTNEGLCFMVADLTRSTMASNDTSASRITDWVHDPTYGDVTSATQRYNHDGAPSANDRTTAFTYYGKGALKSVDGPRNDVTDITTYGTTIDATYGAYDHTGQPLSVTDAAGKTSNYSYTPYGPMSQLIDRQGRTTKTVYDERNNLVKKIDPLNNTGSIRYDADDDPVALTSPRGNATTGVADDYTTFACVDAAQNLLKISTPGSNGLAPASDTCATPASRTAGRAETLASYNADLTRFSKTSPIGGTTTYAYYPNQSVQTVTAPAGTGTSAVTDFTYDRANRVRLVTKPVVDAAGDRPTEDTTYTPSGAMWVYTATSPLTGQRATTTLTYDAFGETVDSKGPRTVGADQAETVTTFDPFGEAIQSHQRVDTTKWIDSFIDYDAAGNRTGTKQPNGSGAVLESDYTYNARNELAAQTRDDSNPGHTVTYSYWDEGQQRNRTDLVSGIPYRSADTVYNADGTEQSTAWTSFDGSGNANGTTSRCDYAQGSNPAAGYDADGHLLTMQTINGGSVCTGGTIAASNIATYDGMGLPSTVNQTVRSPLNGTNYTRTQSFTYNPDDTPASIAHDSRTTTFGTYSVAGWLESMTDWRSRTTTNGYLPSGALSSETRGGVAKADFTYKGDGSLNSLVWSRNVAGSLLRSDTNMAYDIDGSLNTETVTVPPGLLGSTGGNAAMTYDLAGRLTGWTDPFTNSNKTTYNLDDGGNITTEKVANPSGTQLSLTTSTIGSSTGRLDSRTIATSSGSQTDNFTYSGVGEETKRVNTGGTNATTATKYDPAGRVQSTDDRVGATGSIVSYVYDGFDRLVARTETFGSGAPMTTTLYFYWAMGRSLAEESNGVGATNVRYLIDNTGVVLAQEKYAVAGVLPTSWTWLLQNPHGDVATQVDDLGVINEQDSYKPYGGTNTNGTGQAPLTTGSSLGYGSALTDSKTHDVMLGARQYDPSTARFISPDNFVAGSLDLTLGTDTLTGNRFLFAAANPVSFFDNGHWGFHNIGKWIKKHKKALIIAAVVVVAVTAVVLTAGAAAGAEAAIAAEASAAEAAVETAAVVETEAAATAEAAGVATEVTAEASASAAEEVSTGVGHVFYSGEGAQAAATAFAEENGGVTLGMTAEGQATAQATENLPWEEARPLWVRASQQFAESAEGIVHVFQSAAGVRIDSIWAETEWGALLDNPDVQQIVFHIVGGG